jgi:glc operon protein GlcG
MFAVWRCVAHRPNDFERGEVMLKDTQLFLSASVFLLVSTLFTFFTGVSLAQNTDNIIVTGEAARKSLAKNEITGEAAAKIAQACQDFASQHNYATVVFIIDPSGNIVHAHRMDGIRPVQFESALNKAKTALFMRTSTRQLADRIAGNVGEEVRFLMRGLYPYSGGVPVIVDNQLIGAIGVAGSDALDDDCAYAGLTSVLGSQTRQPTPPAQPPSQR